MIVWIHVHRQAMQGIFGEDDEIHCRHVAARLAHRRHDLLRLRGEIRGGDDDRQLQLHDADNDAVWRFVETAEPVHRRLPGPSAAYFAIDSSPGMSRAECLALEVAIMMPSVRM